MSAVVSSKIICCCFLLLFYLCVNLSFFRLIFQIRFRGRKRFFRDNFLVEPVLPENCHTTIQLTNVTNDHRPTENDEQKTSRGRVDDEQEKVS